MKPTSPSVTAGEVVDRCLRLLAGRPPQDNFDVNLATNIIPHFLDRQITSCSLRPGDTIKMNFRLAITVDDLDLSPLWCRTVKVTAEEWIGMSVEQRLRYVLAVPAED